MNTNEKKEILKNLNEKEFRRDLIIPLLSKMGYIAPIEYHGTSEKGKDIVCFEYDKLNEQRFLSIVAKTGDFSGNVALDSGLMTIVHQVQQALDCPYEDLYNMRQVFINEVWVMTTGKIVSGAQESVINTLRKNNLDKQIKIIGNDRLVQLIDNFFSTYWNSSTETKESVIIQRDRLIYFVEMLLKENNVDKSTIESVKSSILYSDYSPSISKNINGLHISNVSPYNIELSDIDLEFDDYIVSKNYGVLKDLFNEAKKHLSYSFLDVEETIWEANKIMKITNPRDFAVEALSRLDGNYPFYNGSRHGDAADFIDNVNGLHEGIREVEIFKSFLKNKGKLELAQKLSKSIIKLLPEVEKIIENAKEDEVFFNYKSDEIGDKIILSFNNEEKGILFKSKYKRIDLKGYKRNKDGSLKSKKVIEDALYSFRDYLEQTLSYDEEKWSEEYEE